MFSGVRSSLCALFGTMSSWSLEPLVPLFHEAPAFRIFFVVFYIYSSWALLAVMTGVVSENMIAIRDQMVKEDARKEELRKEQIIHLLEHLFHEADADSSGQISKEEFSWMVNSPELKNKLSKFSKMEVSDLNDLFTWIDQDASGFINKAEFLDGFRWVNQPLRAPSLVKLFERLGEDIRVVRKGVSRAIEAKAAEVNNLLNEPLRKVHAICELMQSLDTNFGDLAKDVQQPLTVPTQKELYDAEQRLVAKLTTVINRLEEIEESSYNVSRLEAAWSKYPK